MGNGAILPLLRGRFYLRLENWNHLRFGSSSLHELHHGPHRLGAARLLRLGTSRRLFCKHGDRLRRSELHERRLPPLPSPSFQPSLDRDAGSSGAHSRQDEGVRLACFPRFGLYGAFLRVDCPSQNECARGQTCPLGAPESRRKGSFAGKQNQARESSGSLRRRTTANLKPAHLCKLSNSTRTKHGRFAEPSSFPRLASAPRPSGNSGRYPLLKETG